MHQGYREHFPRHQLQRRSLVSYPGFHHGTCHARAVMHVGIANLRWRGERPRHSRRMRNPHFYVSSKRPMAKPMAGKRVFILKYLSASISSSSSNHVESCDFLSAITFKSWRSFWVYYFACLSGVSAWGTADGLGTTLLVFCGRDIFQWLILGSYGYLLRDFNKIVLSDMRVAFRGRVPSS